jgi:hypothetical protein
LVHCSDCGVKEDLTLYKGRHLCRSCAALEGKKPTKTASEAKAILYESLAVNKTKVEGGEKV